MAVPSLQHDTKNDRDHGKDLLSERRKSQASITIGKSPAEVFAFWRDFKNLPRFMKDISKIEILSPMESHWEVQLKSGLTASWTAKVVDEALNEMISWESLPESEVETSGAVWFEEAPNNLGTVVRLSMDYKIPGGKLAELATALTGESPELLAITNLKRLKGYLETGVIATTEGQPSGREQKEEFSHTGLKH